MWNSIKSFYRSHRVGSTSGKTLLWIWVKRDLSKFKGDTGVDLAGGGMLNKRFFKTNKYICVDINKGKLEKGKNSNLDAIAVNSKIQDFLKENQQTNLDVLLCVQTMGTSRFFEHDEVLKVVTSMHNSLRKGGSMIFNVGKSGNQNLITMENELSLMLRGKFKRIDSKFYGFLFQPFQISIPRPVLLILAYLMNIFPLLRTLFGLKKEKLYFCCQSKL